MFTKVSVSSETHNVLVQHSTADLATVAGQHLFISFIWTVIEYLPKDFLDQGGINILDSVTVQPPEAYDLLSRSQFGADRKLSHRKLTRFALHAEKEGLGALDDVLLCLIPVLSLKDVLPNDATLNFDQPKPELLEREKWKQTLINHFNFLDWMEKNHGFNTDDHLCLSAVVNALDLVYLMALDMRNMEYKSNVQHDETADTNMNHELYEWESRIKEADSMKSPISSDLEKLLGHLSRVFPKIIKKLSFFYELQRRKKDFCELFNRYSGLNATEILSQEQRITEDYKFMEQIGFTDLHREILLASNNHRIDLCQLLGGCYPCPKIAVC